MKESIRLFLLTTLQDMMSLGIDNILMFGKEPVLPTDVLLETDREIEAPKSYSQYVGI